MGTKHTPGPLAVRRESEWPYSIVTTNAAGEIVWQERAVVTSSEQRTLADFESGFGLFGIAREVAVEANERQFADALLRAAAPDLLQAAQAIEFAMRMPGVTAAEVLDENSPIRDGLRSAIARATGGAAQ